MAKKRIIENLITDKLESASWDVVRAIQSNGNMPEDEASDLHLLLLDFAKEIQRNAIYLTIGEIIKAQKHMVSNLQ